MVEEPKKQLPKWTWVVPLILVLLACPISAFFVRTMGGGRGAEAEETLVVTNSDWTHKRLDDHLGMNINLRPDGVIKVRTQSGRLFRRDSQGNNCEIIEDKCVPVRYFGDTDFLEIQAFDRTIVSVGVDWIVRQEQH